mmetsp:Transcript_12938/g.20323  ORF Transcript_12938/g.20323 Transcript_12938/m.20323 type:complete len:252 (+) Transcript_12938:3-758(+)
MGGFLLGTPLPASAGKARKAVAVVGEGEETAAERRARIVAERKEMEERRKEIEEKEAELMAGKEKVEAEMGSNLRGDYYYPTARKRYLPRVKRAYDELQPLLASLQDGTADFAAVAGWIKGSGDVSGPMKLYVSALGGGGLSISSKFMGAMTEATGNYEESLKKLKEAAKKKKTEEALAAAQQCEEFLLAYRQAGKPAGLTGDDWGVGEIPDCSKGSGTGKMSACAVGSSFSNANPNIYKRNIRASEGVAQ